MIENSRYEILTPDGFKDFDFVTKNTKELLQISTENFSTIVSKNHPFEVMGEIYNSSNLEIGGLLDTINGLEEIINIIELDYSDEVYDIINVEDCRNYYGDGILQHNCFYGSTYTLVELDSLLIMKEKLQIDHNKPETYPIRSYNINVFKKPVRNRLYVIGADVGDGVGANESVITVFDITEPTEKIEQVASFSDNKISRTEFSYLLAKVGTLYNYGPILIESNNMGSSIIDFLFTVYEYENLAKVGVKRGYGILSNNNIKCDACLNFKFLMDTQDINVILYDNNLYKQLEWFVRKEFGNGKYTYLAEKKKLDDHVLANIWALYILKLKNLQYFFDFDTVDINLQQIPTKLVPYYSTETTLQMDKSIDKTYDELQTKMKHVDNLEPIENVDSVNSNDSIDYENENNNGSSLPNATREEDFINTLGFFQM